MASYRMYGGGSISRLIAVHYSRKPRGITVSICTTKCHKIHTYTMKNYDLVADGYVTVDQEKVVGCYSSACLVSVAASKQRINYTDKDY